jgi:hypothetical protein
MLRRVLLITLGKLQAGGDWLRRGALQQDCSTLLPQGHRHLVLKLLCVHALLASLMSAISSSRAMLMSPFCSLASTSACCAAWPPSTPASD